MQPKIFGLSQKNGVMENLVQVIQHLEQKHQNPSWPLLNHSTLWEDVDVCVKMHHACGKNNSCPSGWQHSCDTGGNNYTKCKRSFSFLFQCQTWAWRSVPQNQPCRWCLSLHVVRDICEVFGLPCGSISWGLRGIPSLPQGNNCGRLEMDL